MSVVRTYNGKSYTIPDDLIGDDFFGYSDIILSSSGLPLPVAIAMLDDAVLEAARLRTATSATSKNGGLTGSQTWVLTSDITFPEGSYVTIARTSDPSAVSYFAVVTGYDSGTQTLTVAVEVSVGGGGPYTDWSINVSGPRGPAGATLPVADSTVLVQGSVDATKQFRIEVDGNSASSTRVATTSDYDGVMRLQAIGSDVASASTINLDTATGDCVTVTGTTTITAITLAEGKEATIRFNGTLTLTHGASLVLPGAANITTAAGDMAVFRGYSAGVVRCVHYQRASGYPVSEAASFSANKNGTDQTGIAAATSTKITFTTELWDTHGWYDAANSRFTPLRAGKYRVTIQLVWSASNIVDAQLMQALIYKNGSLYKGSSDSSSGTGTQGITAVGIVDMNGSSDYIEAYGYLAGAGNKTISGLATVTYFEAEYVGP